MTKKKKTAKKPVLWKKEYYYWTDIVRYIEEKYNKDIRDWSDRWKPKHNPDAPYQDFWHSILEKFCIVQGNNEMWEVIWEDYLPRTEKWEKEIIDILIDEGFSGVEINFSW